MKRWGKGRRPFVEGFLGLIGKVIQSRTCHARSIMTHLVIIHPHKFDSAQATFPAQVSQGPGGVFTRGEGNESSPDHGRVCRESLAFTALDRPAFCVHLLPFPVQFTASRVGGIDPVLTSLFKASRLVRIDSLVTIMTFFRST